MSGVEVDCSPESDGWTCAVDVVDPDSQSHHNVRVKAGDLARLDPTAPDPTDLVHRSFEFLLQRESKESILLAFDLTDIGRYFPAYESMIKG